MKQWRGARSGRWGRLLAVLALAVAAWIAGPPAVAGAAVLGVAEDYGCAVQITGTPVCWGANDHGQLTIPAGTAPVVSVTAGATHACAIRRTDSTAVCWGSDSFGKATVPPQVGPVSNVSAGGSATCAVRKAGGELACWGKDAFEGPMTPPSGSFVRVEVATGFACAIRDADRTVACWGTGPGATVPAYLGRVISLGAGQGHACAIRIHQRDVGCWGVSSPQINSIPAEATAISVGPRSACAINVRGYFGCWGQTQPVPAQADGATSADHGSFHNCVVKGHRFLYCWGDDTSGRVSGATGLGSIGAKPMNLGRPQVLGDRPAVGDTVTLDRGLWDNDPSRTEIAGWQRCAGSTCTTITEADATDGDTTYTLTAADAGTRVRAGVRASNLTGGPILALSPRSAVVGAPVAVVAERPTLSGASTVGGVLTATTGGWDHEPTAFRYTFQRCAATAPHACTPITGTADADDGDATYTLTGADQGSRLRVRVVGSNAAGSGAAVSALRPTVRAGE